MDKKDEIWGADALADTVANPKAVANVSYDFFRVKCLLDQ